MKLIDTHAHLATPGIKNNIEQIIKEAKQAGVDKIISIGCSIDEAKTSIELAEKFPSIYATVGLYPHDSKSETQIPISERLDIIRQLAAHKKVVAIGESGLDYADPSPHEVKRVPGEQKALFRSQIEMARDLNLPIVIHSRLATQDTIDLLEEEYKKSPFKAVWHCYTENSEIAKQLVKMNMMISITGIVTYKSGQALREVIKQTPLQNIMLETDSPFLVPHSARSAGIKLNTPKYVKIIAEEIADITGISLDEVAKITTANASAFFNI